MPPTNEKYLTYISAKEDVLNLVFSYQIPVAPKSLVATFKWIPDETLTEEKLNLTWSDALKCYFTYAPKADFAGLRPGPTLHLPSPGRLEIRLLNWPAKTLIRPNIVSGLYAGVKSPAAETTFVGLQRIHQNGINA